MLEGRGRINFFPIVLYHTVAADELVMLSPCLLSHTLCVSEPFPAFIPCFPQ